MQHKVCFTYSDAPKQKPGLRSGNLLTHQALDNLSDIYWKWYIFWIWEFNLIVQLETWSFTSDDVVDQRTGNGQEVANLWNFTSRSVASHQLCVSFINPRLSLIDVTHAAACSHNAWAAWEASSSVAASSHTESVTWLNQQNHPGSHAQRKVTPRCAFIPAPALRHERLPCHSERGAALCCLSKN